VRTIHDTEPFWSRSGSSPAASRVAFVILLTLCVGIATSAPAEERRSIEVLYLAQVDDEDEAAAREQAAADQPPEAVEEITVTGTHIKRQSFSTPNPVQVLDRENIELQGIDTVSDLVRNLTANAGSEFNANAFTQNASVGTAQFNLRGLGLNSTLVLLNGRRINTAPVTADDGSVFVDVNHIPLEIVERVEILLNGASAIYGSDAIAGVVNLITRQDVDGFELGGRFQTTTQDSQEDRRLHGSFGISGDKGHMSTFVSYLNRTPLRNTNRNFTKRTTNVFAGPPETAPGSGVFQEGGVPQPSRQLGLATSQLGQPGTFVFLDPMTFTPVGQLPDPECGNIEGSAVDPVSGFCTFNFNPFFELVAREERINVYTNGEYAFGESLEFFGEFMFSRNTAKRFQSPSFPIVAEFPVVSPLHPDFPADFSAAFPGSPALFLGRPLGALSGPEEARRRSTQFRTVGAIEGDYGDLASGLGAWASHEQGDEWISDLGFFEDWSWDAEVVWSQTDTLFESPDTLDDRFTAAINGTGGPKSAESLPTFSPERTFNPFGNAFTTGTPNDPAVIEDFTGLIRSDSKSQLITMDISTSGSVYELPWSGPVDVAIGAQARWEELTVELDHNSNRDNFLFAVGGNDAALNRWIGAFYFENSIPVMDGATAEWALRYENYGDGGDDEVTFSVLGDVYPFENQFVSGMPEFLSTLRLRGNWGQSFRAPSLVQAGATQTRLEQITDPLGGGPTFRAIRTVGNPELDSETSDNWSVGFEWEPIEDLEFSANYWDYAINDVVVQPNAQAFVNNNPNQTCDMFDTPCIQRDPVSGAIQIVFLQFINASDVDVSGLDLEGQYTFELDRFGIDLPVDPGMFRFTARATWTREYEITLDQGGGQSVTFDAVGFRNFTNFARSLPEWRANFMLDWMKGNHTASVIVRYTSSYKDDEDFDSNGFNNATGEAACDDFDNANSLCFEQVDDYTTVDLSYSYLWEKIGKGTTFRAGIINVFDENPSEVETNGGYDATIGDPRGRMVWVGLQQRW